MMSNVDYEASSSVWCQDKWKGQFKVKWVYVKDVPNSALRHIRIESNENKPVTNSRDTQVESLRILRRICQGDTSKFWNVIQPSGSTTRQGKAGSEDPPHLPSHDLNL